MISISCVEVLLGTGVFINGSFEKEATFIHVSQGPKGHQRTNDKYKMVREPNVSPHKQIIKDDDVKECISIE